MLLHDVLKITFPLYRLKIKQIITSFDKYLPITMDKYSFYVYKH